MDRPKRAKVVKVGDTWICGITTYSINMEDIDSEESGRDENLDMHREVLREKVMKISVTCTQDNPEVFETCGLIEGETVEMTVLCPGFRNAEGSYYATAEFYISKVKLDVIFYNNGETVWSLSFNAIEV